MPRMPRVVRRGIIPIRPSDAPARPPGRPAPIGISRGPDDGRPVVGQRQVVLGAVRIFAAVARVIVGREGRELCGGGGAGAGGGGCRVHGREGEGFTARNAR